MPDKQLDEIPTEVKEQLTDGSQEIFSAAFNSAKEDGMEVCHLCNCNDS